VEAFFTSHKVPAADRTLKLTIEEINGCIDLREHQEHNLQTWLKQQPTGTATGAQ
jgi:hypothetical protein